MSDRPPDSPAFVYTQDDGEQVEKLLAKILKNLPEGTPVNINININSNSSDNDTYNSSIASNSETTVIGEIKAMKAPHGENSIQPSKWERFAVFVFGVMFLIGLSVLSISLPNPTLFQYTVFRIILALAAAGVAAFIPGFIQVEVNTWVRAGGAIAVFVMVYFFSPAGLVSENIPKEELRQKTTGVESALEKATHIEKAFTTQTVNIWRLDTPDSLKKENAVYSFSMLNGSVNLTLSRTHLSKNLYSPGDDLQRADFYIVGGEPKELHVHKGTLSKEQKKIFKDVFRVGDRYFHIRLLSVEDWSVHLAISEIDDRD